jgi:hypothetical protein
MVGAWPMVSARRGRRWLDFSQEQKVCYPGRHICTCWKVVDCKDHRLAIPRGWEASIQVGNSRRTVSFKGLFFAARGCSFILLPDSHGFVSSFVDIQLRSTVRVVVGIPHKSAWLLCCSPSQGPGSHWVFNYHSYQPI